MFKKLMKNKKAQNTAEYAILIALVVAAVVAMQIYAQRALQARIRDASVYMANSAGQGILGNTLQYEPYYLSSDYQVLTQTDERQELGADKNQRSNNNTRTRDKGGFQNQLYNGRVTADNDDPTQQQGQ